MLTLGLATLQKKALRKVLTLLLPDFTGTVPLEQCDLMGYLAVIYNMCWKGCLPSGQRAVPEISLAYGCGTARLHDSAFLLLFIVKCSQRVCRGLTEFFGAFLGN